MSIKLKKKGWIKKQNENNEDELCVFNRKRKEK